LNASYPFWKVANFTLTNYSADGIITMPTTYNLSGGVSLATSEKIVLPVAGLYSNKCITILKLITASINIMVQVVNAAGNGLIESYNLSVSTGIGSIHTCAFAFDYFGIANTNLRMRFIITSGTIEHQSTLWHGHLVAQTS
jgi:hypothetical protein